MGLQDGRLDVINGFAIKIPLKIQKKMKKIAKFTMAMTVKEETIV